MAERNSGLNQTTLNLIASVHEELDRNREVLEQSIRYNSSHLSCLLGELRGSVDHETILKLYSVLRRQTALLLADFAQDCVQPITLDQLDQMRSPAEQVEKIIQELEAAIGEE